MRLIQLWELYFTYLKQWKTFKKKQGSDFRELLYSTFSSCSYRDSLKHFSFSRLANNPLT